MKWNSEKIVSSCAILISLMTLFVLIYQTNIIREQQRMSVLPYLSLTNEHTGRPDYRLILKNNGIGPAFIESVVVVYEEKEYYADLPVFFLEHFSEMDTLKNIYHSNLMPGLLVPPGTVIPIFQVDNSLSSARSIYELIHKRGVSMKIVYRSIYDEKWLLSDESNFPQKID